MNPEPVKREYIVQTWFSRQYVQRNRPTILWTTNDPSEAQRFTLEEAEIVREEVNGRVLLATDAMDLDADEVAK